MLPVVNPASQKNNRTPNGIRLLRMFVIISIFQNLTITLPITVKPAIGMKPI